MLNSFLAGRGANIAVPSKFSEKQCPNDVEVPLASAKDKQFAAPLHSRTPSPSPLEHLGRLIASPYSHQGIRSRSPSPLTPRIQRCVRSAPVTPASDDAQLLTEPPISEKFTLIPLFSDDARMQSIKNFGDEAIMAAVQAAASQLKTTKFSNTADQLQNDVSNEVSDGDITKMETVSDVAPFSLHEEVMSFASSDAIAYSLETDQDASSIQDETGQVKSIATDSYPSFDSKAVELSIASSDVSTIMRPQEPWSVINTPELKRANPILDTEQLVPRGQTSTANSRPPISVLYFENRIKDEDFGQTTSSMTLYKS